MDMSSRKSMLLSARKKHLIARKRDLPPNCGCSLMEAAGITFWHHLLGETCMKWHGQQVFWVRGRQYGYPLIRALFHLPIFEKWPQSYLCFCLFLLGYFRTGISLEGHYLCTARPLLNQVEVLPKKSFHHIRAVMTKPPCCCCL
jgi:hypothetical protein